MDLEATMNSQNVTTNDAKDAKPGVALLFKTESYRIMGACFEVYKEQGCGFLEAVYQECLALEFKSRGIPFAEKPLLGLTYKRQTLRQNYEPDFLCFDAIIVEIKSARQLVNEHRAQCLNYLKATGKSLALLVNFGHHPGLESERFVQQGLSRVS